MIDLVNVLAKCNLPVETYDIAKITSMAVTILKIAVPVLLIIWGMLDLGKAVMAQKEDEIKKGQQTFIKRLVAAALVFFIVTIVGLVIKLIGGDKDGAWGCAKCFINGGCTESDFEYDSTSSNAGDEADDNND